MCLLLGGGLVVVEQCGGLGHGDAERAGDSAELGLVGHESAGLDLADVAFGEAGSASEFGLGPPSRLPQFRELLQVVSSSTRTRA